MSCCRSNNRYVRLKASHQQQLGRHGPCCATRCHVFKTLETCHEPKSDSAKNSILSSSCRHSSCSVMLLHQTHRAGQQGYTAEAHSMPDGGSAVETQTNCSMPFLQGLQVNTCGRGDARHNTSWVPHHDHQAWETKEAHRWVQPLGHASTLETQSST